MAARLADLLVADPIFGAKSGLFLAAPRRTGKSTFLRRDLVPLLQQRGKTVQYVDLWADRAADPARINANLAAHLQVSVDQIDRAFAALGRKPEMLLECLRALVTTLEPGATALERIVAQKQAEIAAARRAEILSLSNLQQALLRMLVADGAPFSATARDRLKPANAGRAPSIGAIQKALEVLRDKGFVWRPGYGAYALENAEIAGALQAE